MNQLSILKKLLLKDAGRSRLRTAWIALCAGVTLLLAAIMIWWNFRQMLEGKKSNDSLGSTFLTVNKKLTDEYAGAPHFFSEEEIAEIKKAPQVQDAGALIPAAFSANISMGGRLGFSTLLPLEAVPERFMDKRPQDWTWKEGDMHVPVIIPREFLNQYNFVFAPSQGLPSLSETAIRSIGFSLTIGNAGRQEQFVGHVAGFSDRITSILAPESFVKHYNAKLASDVNRSPSRLIVKAKDPSDRAFADFLSGKGYVTNAEQLKWNRLRTVVEVISVATGVLAVLLIGVSALVFLLFIELTLAKAKGSIQLLLQIGYGPRYLRKFMTKKFLPVMLSAVFASLIIACGIQMLSHYALKHMELHVGLIPGYPVIIVAGTCILLLIWQMKRTIGNALTRI